MNPTFRSPGLVRLLLRALLRPLFRVQVTGDPGVFTNERTLIVANHESFLDGMLLGAFLPIDAVFVVHAQVLAKWYFRFILRFVPHLAVDYWRSIFAAIIKSLSVSPSILCVHKVTPTFPQASKMSG